MTHYSEVDLFTVPAETVTWDEIGGEVVAINLVSGHYHSLRGTARDVFVLIDAGLAVDELIPLLASPSVSADQVRVEVREFVADLAAAGLITPALLQSAPSHRKPSPTMTEAARRDWSPPVLETYTDLEDLMLLDPVHEVDDQGWPRAAAPTEADRCENA